MPKIPQLEHELVLQIHTILRDRDDESGEALGNKLPYRGLGCFLDLCHYHNLGSLENRDAFKKSIMHMIGLTEIFLSNIPCASAAVGDSDSSKEAIEVLGAVSLWLKGARDFIKRFGVAMEEAHGAILGDISIDTLYENLARVVDVDSMKAWASQLAIIQAALQAGANNEVSKLLEEVDDLIDEYLASLGQE